MKSTAFSLLAAACAVSASPLESRATTVQGFDISSYQGTVDFSGAYGAGARFVMIKVCANDPFLTILALLKIQTLGDRGHYLYRFIFLKPL